MITNFDLYKQQGSRYNLLFALAIDAIAPGSVVCSDGATWWPAWYRALEERERRELCAAMLSQLLTPPVVGVA